MATWDEFYDEEDSNGEIEEENLALMALTLSDLKSESSSDSESDEEDKMTSYSNLGMGNQLGIIIEGQVDFDEIMAHGLDLQRIVSHNGWNKFFDMLCGPFYPNLVKKFWVNASIQDPHLKYAILSEVSDVPITITRTSISNAINYEEEGVVLDMLFWDSYLPSHLIFEDLFDLSKVSNINSKALVWYHLLIFNFLPKNKDLTSLDIDEKDFMLLLNSDLKIDLPQVKFKYLKMTLTSFKEGKSSFIPYQMDLSELFIQQGVEITMTGVKT
ncbi:hypothetical protein KIW84_071976 [Lathyrus oleraceus]|uniref:Putative plant transposon protein domain-containing protein n=1 Tax=Pisum sativum TaxID=3888 RepID=A0A9D4ZTS5_PEA|nr:hypothetical protein KIW84_071976 [Pisum sativum]